MSDLSIIDSRLAEILEDVDNHKIWLDGIASAFVDRKPELSKRIAMEGSALVRDVQRCIAVIGQQVR